MAFSVSEFLVGLFIYLFMFMFGVSSEWFSIEDEGEGGFVSLSPSINGVLVVVVVGGFMKLQAMGGRLRESRR